MVERRHLTILFCDMVGFTTMAERIDPEDLYEFERHYQRLCVGVIEALGGFVARFEGDGLLACFGYPAARGNDAERAVRAALGLLEQTPKLRGLVSGRDGFVPPSLRVGVHTGLVVLGPEESSGWRRDHGVVGEAVNLAARLQADAEPDSVLISGDTHALVEGLFHVQALGARAIRGLSRPVPVFRVLGASPVPNRTGSRLRRGATRLVGRGEELRRLIENWSAVVSAGRLRVVRLVGEAGVGKSRLVLDFLDAIRGDDFSLVRLHCLELFAATPLFPLVSLLRTEAAMLATDDPATQRAKLRETLERRVGAVGEADFEALAGLLGLGDAGGAGPEAPTSPQARKLRFEALSSLFARLAHARPAVLWVEDAHWIDPSTAEFVAGVAGRSAGSPVLLVMTARPEPAAAHVPGADDVIRLDPLPPEQSVELARSVPGAQALQEGVLRQVAAVGDGIPLFIEQLTISAVEQSGGRAARDGRAAGAAAAGFAVPMTLSEILSERLDRFPGARPVMQAAAAIGRPFTVQLLAEVLEWRAADVGAAVDVLVDANILSRRRLDNATEYQFRHSLLQRAAYASMVQAARRQTHSRIAAVLEASRPHAARTPPELIAHHQTAAGSLEPAVLSWTRAGRDAVRKSANLEALEHLERGLDLVARVPDAAARRRLELDLRATQLAPLIACKGYCAQEVAACCRRGLALCMEDEDNASPLVFPFLYGYFTWSMTSGRAREAVTTARLFLSLAERSGYEPGLVIGHRLLGMSLFASGEVAQAREALDTAMRLYREDRDEAVTYLFGQSAKVTAQSLMSLVMFCRGEVDSALALGLETMRAANQLRHPLSKAIAATYIGGWVLGLCGAKDEVQREARRLIEFCDLHNVRIFRAYGELFLGWALCGDGHVAQGMWLMEQAIAAFDQAGWRLTYPSCLALLADARRRAGRLEEAADLCRQAKRLVREGGGADGWFEPEILRIEAHVLHELFPGDPGRAAAGLRDAVECARRYGSVTFELRCLLSHRDLFGRSAPDEGVSRRIQELAHLPPVNRRVVERALARARSLAAPVAGAPVPS